MGSGGDRHRRRGAPRRISQCHSLGCWCPSNWYSDVSRGSECASTRSPNPGALSKHDFSRQLLIAWRPCLGIFQCKMG